MTRFNLVPPEELMDQHLFAEFREIKMVPKSLRRSIAASGATTVLRNIPTSYRLNTGHVSFFHDKGAYLHQRYEALKAELCKRGINFKKDSPLDPDGIYFIHPAFYNNYEPTPEALCIIRQRIAEKIAMRPGWYRHSGDYSEPV